MNEVNIKFAFIGTDNIFILQVLINFHVSKI
jgi:hypothetical protein